MTALIEVVLIGVVIGIVIGTLGAGGAIFTIPVLVYLIGMQPFNATTASLVIVGTSAIVAATAHARSRHVRWVDGIAFGLLGIVGTWSGTLIARGIDPNALMMAFAVLVLAVAGLMWRRRREGSDNGGLATMIRFHPLRFDWPRLGLLLATASGIGLLTGLFGVGGGFAVVPALVLIMDFPMAIAVGTSLVVIVVNSATALAARFAGGLNLDWPVVVGFSLASIVGSLIGARMTKKINPTLLRRVFAALLIAVALYSGIRSWMAL